MTTIRGVVRNGQIQTEKPLNLPDGTELTIPVPTLWNAVDLRDERLADTPESIAAWLRWYEGLEPLELTASEHAAWEAARQEQKEFELAQWEKDSKRMEGLFS